MKLSRLKVRSEIWGSSKPSAGNIGLYLFPHEMRHNANLDELINEIMGNDLVLRAVIGEAEMLIFPSCLLPEGYKTFQSKNYLWALFKQRDDKFAAAAKALNGTAWCAQEEEKGKEQASKHVDSIEPNQETILTESAMPLDSQGLGNLHLGMEKQTSEGSVTAEGFQFKTPDERKQEDARRHSAHVAEATAAATNSSAVIAEATANATIASNVPANHKQSNPDTGAQPGKIIFVGAQTPRVEQMLQEMVREGSLELFMRAEKISLGPEPGSIATTMQQGTQHHRLDVRIISEPPPT